MSCYEFARSRILLVDDSAALRAVLETLLRGLGVETVYATGDAAEAIVLANTCRPDLALVDYDLDGESGLDMIRRLRDPRFNPAPDIPLLLLAPVELPHLVAGAQRAGATAILPKPLNASTLAMSLETVMQASGYNETRAVQYN